MLFPKNRMRLTDIYMGKTDPEGWIVLDLKGLDLEGASKLYLSLADIHKIQSGGDVQSAKLAQARALLASFDSEDDAEDEDANA